MALLSLAVLLLTVIFLAHRSRATIRSFLSSHLQVPKRQSRGGLSQSDDDAGESSESIIPAATDDLRTLTDAAGPPAIEFQARISDYSDEDAASSMSPAPPAQPKRSASQLMPPPQRPASSSAPSTRPNLSAQTALRVPSTGPLPNRLPPATTNLSALRANGAATAPTLKPRKQVVLRPGHSPLDWAALTRDATGAAAARLTGLPPGAPLQRVTPSRLAACNGRRGAPAWAAFRGSVYNIGAYLPFHPGGEGELLRAAGKGARGEAERLFADVHPWVNLGMIDACLVGVLVAEGEGEGEAQGESELASVD